MSYVGHQTIEWLFEEQLKVDEQWCVRTPRGFRWWADQQAQTIEAERAEERPDGDLGFILSIRTELLRNVAPDLQSLPIVHTMLMQGASLAGPVYDKEQHTLSLCSRVRMHNGIAGWMNPVLSVAAALQISEARSIGKELAKAIGADPIQSGHPRSGIRQVPDEIAQLDEALFIPMGQGPSRWPAEEFRSTVKQYMQRPPATMATDGGSGFTVEFPFGDYTSLCRAVSNHPHPLYGSGLLVLQSFPHGTSTDVEGIQLALDLNKAELVEEGPFGYGFGSFAYRQGMLHHAAFFPNAMYRPGLLPNLYMASAGRAREVARRLTGRDWSEASFKAKSSAIGRLVDRFRARG